MFKPEQAAASIVAKMNRPEDADKIPESADMSGQDLHGHIADELYDHISSGNRDGFKTALKSYIDACMPYSKE